MRGWKFVAYLDPRVITSHVVEQLCNSRFPVTVKTSSQAWVTVGFRVIQVNPLEPITLTTSYHSSETVSILYTTEELQAWEQFQVMLSFQQCRHQCILNSLCTDDSCTYGSQGLLDGMNLKDLKKHIQEGGEALLESLNPFAVFLAVFHTPDA